MASTGVPSATGLTPTTEGLDGLADDARPGRPPLVPRAKLERIVDGVKRSTAYEFVELVKKKTGVKYSEPHGRRLLRSLGFVVKKTPRISDRAPKEDDVGAVAVFVRSAQRRLDKVGSGPVRGNACLIMRSFHIPIRA